MKKIIGIGGYALKHSYLALRDYILSSSNKYQTTIGVSPHFTQNITDSSPFFTKIWGQHKRELPSKSQELLEDVRPEEELQIKHIGYINNRIEKILIEDALRHPDKLQIFFYQNNGIRYESTPAEFKIIFNTGTHYYSQKSLVGIVDCRLKPRRYSIEEWAPYDGPEEFMTQPLSDTPILIAGYRGSALWIFEECNRKPTKTQFYGAPRNVDFEDIPRRNIETASYVLENISNYILNDKKYYPTPALRLLGAGQSQHEELKQTYLYEWKKRKILEEHWQLAVLHDIDLKFLDIVRVVACIGYEENKWDLKEKYIPIFFDPDRMDQDIVPENSKRSVIHHYAELTYVLAKLMGVQGDDVFKYSGISQGIIAKSYRSHMARTNHAQFIDDEYFKIYRRVLKEKSMQIVPTENELRGLYEMAFKERMLKEKINSREDIERIFMHSVLPKWWSQ